MLKKVIQQEIMLELPVNTKNTDPFYKLGLSCSTQGESVS